MSFDPAIHHRRSLRLKGYDYAQAGAYFVTICTQDRACLFGEVVDGEMRLNEWGEIVSRTWHDLPNHVANVALDEFVVMPNHIHGIIVIDNVVGAGSGVGARHAVPLQTVPPQTERFGRPVAGSIPTIIRSFKSAVTKQINEQRATPGMPVWQRNYYEHIIRNEASLARIRDYIVNNPMQWALDRENPENVGAGLVPAQSMQRENV